MFIKNIGHNLKKIIFPAFCIECGVPNVENPLPLRWLCSKCHTKLKPEFKKTKLGLEINESYYVFDYQKNGIIRKIIHTFKYNLVKDLVEVINIQLEKERLNIKKINNIDFIIPVPLHPKKLRERGFNQSELIGQKIAEITGKLMLINTLARKIYKKPQAEIKKKEKREENAKNLFETKDKAQILGQSVLLVDDVATTGATLKECARVLKLAGAKYIYSFTLAQD